MKYILLALQCAGVVTGSSLRVPHVARPGHPSAPEVDGSPIEHLTPLANSFIGGGVTAREEETEYYIKKATEFPGTDEVSLAQVNLDAQMSLYQLQAAAIVTAEGCEQSFYALGKSNKGGIQLNVIAAKTCSETMRRLSMLSKVPDFFPDGNYPYTEMQFTQSAIVHASNNACSKVRELYGAHYVIDGDANTPPQSKAQLSCNLMRNELAAMLVTVLRATYLQSYTCAIDGQDTGRFIEPGTPLGYVSALTAPTKDTNPYLPCSGAGLCKANQCFCKAGFSGPDCSAKTCDSGCEDNSYCTEEGRCSCLIGFTGPDCTTRVCPIVNGQTCNAHGDCRMEDQTCMCDDGWRGTGCDSPQSSVSIEEDIATTEDSSKARKIYHRAVIDRVNWDGSYGVKDLETGEQGSMSREELWDIIVPEKKLEAVVPLLDVNVTVTAQLPDGRTVDAVIVDKNEDGSFDVKFNHGDSVVNDVQPDALSPYGGYVDRGVAEEGDRVVIRFGGLLMEGELETIHDDGTLDIKNDFGTTQFNVPRSEVTPSAHFDAKDVMTLSSGLSVIVVVVTGSGTPQYFPGVINNYKEDATFDVTYIVDGAEKHATVVPKDVAPLGGLSAIRSPNGGVEAAPGASSYLQPNQVVIAPSNDGVYTQGVIEEVNSDGTLNVRTTSGDSVLNVAPLSVTPVDSTTFSDDSTKVLTNLKVIYYNAEMKEYTTGVISGGNIVSGTLNIRGGEGKDTVEIVSVLPTNLIAKVEEEDVVDVHNFSIGDNVLVVTEGGEKKRGDVESVNVDGTLSIRTVDGKLEEHVTTDVVDKLRQEQLLKVSKGDLVTFEYTPKTLPANRCSDSCSGHGVCVPTCEGCTTSFCDCEQFWEGDSCEIKQCPLNCLNPRGTCNNGICNCKNGYSGTGCEVNDRIDSLCATKCQDSCLTNEECVTPRYLLEDSKDSDSLRLHCTVDCLVSCIFKSCY